MNLYDELRAYLLKFNVTMQKYLNISRSVRSPIQVQFFNEFEQIYEELTDDAYNTNNSTKYTVYLWDDSKFNDYISSVMSYQDYSMQQKLERLINTIKNHIVKFHHVTQSIVSNNVEVETLASKKLRTSTFNIENVSIYLMRKIAKYLNLTMFRFSRNFTHRIN